MKKYPLYRFLRPIITFIIKKLFKVNFYCTRNIPKKGPYILVGNHKSNLDCMVVISAVKETVHFLAKRELIDGKLGFFFKRMGIIPVDRKKRNKEAMDKAREVLNEGGVIGIFPEGTFNRTEYIVMPFKMGSVKLAYDTNVTIIPFAIMGKYRLFGDTKVVFGRPYKIKTTDLKGENITLMNKVIRLMQNDNTRKVKEIKPVKIKKA